MSQYTFTFKKDNIFVEFTTTDKYIVERQFANWVNAANVYAQKHANKAPQVTTNQETSKSEEPLNKVVDPVINQPVEPIAEKQPAVEHAPIIEEQKEIVNEKQEMDSSEVKKEIEEEQVQTVENEEVFDKASSLLKTINSIQNPESDNAENQVAESVDFEKVLEESIEATEAKTEPKLTEPSNVKEKDEKFLELVELKGTNDKFHYLIIASYYISEVEKSPRFSLKQLNSKLMQNLGVVVDHGILQDALTQGFIDIVPDLTGVSDICEYTLTELGEEFFNTKI